MLLSQAPQGYILPTSVEFSDYWQTSSVTTMLGNLNWRTLDQRRIDSRFVMLYKVTYDLVAIPAYAYLIPNRRESKSIHPLAYKQIPTSTN